MAKNIDFTGAVDDGRVADAIYGAPPPPPPNPNVVARPISIDTIWADVKQPRRAVPANIRLYWNGDPDKVVALLAQWREVAGMDVPTVATLLGSAGDGFDIDNLSPVAAEYVALCRLAASIHADGLINPISVAEESSGRTIIESGERRWLAFHLLNQILGGYEKIPAIRSDGVDYIWRQASENTARRQLNAISMARQLALLIMAARDDQYQEYGEMVQPGSSDRGFYAQVADGNTHRVPKGFGERIQSAMGLNMDMLSRYRSLLRLSDDEHVNDVIWLRADLEDWPEGAMREIRDTLTIVKVRELVLDADWQWTLDDLRQLAAAHKPRPAPSLPERAPSPTAENAPNDGLPMFVRGTRVITAAGQGGIVQGMRGGLVQVDMGNGARLFSPLQLTIDEPARPAAIPKTDYSPPPAAGVIHIPRVGQAVRVKATGEVGVVKRTHSDSIDVDVAGAYVNYKWSEVIDLLMTFDAWIQAEIAEEAADRADTFESGYAEYPGDYEREFASVSGSGKSPSQKLKPAMVFDADNGDFHWTLLERLKPALQFLKLSGAVRAVEGVQNMSVAAAQALRENNATEDTLDDYHAAVAAALTDLMEHFDEALNRVIRAAFDE